MTAIKGSFLHFGLHFGPKKSKIGIKFDEFLIANERHFQGSLKCVEVCEPQLLTEPVLNNPGANRPPTHTASKLKPSSK